MAPLDRKFRNVALTGFMGTGKTTVGNILAEHLHFELIDTDKVIEERQGQRVSDIFAESGEAAFRTLESELIAELDSANGLVIATGGGLILNPDNRMRLCRHSLMACLWASADTIHERIRHQIHRPLLRAPEPLKRIQELLEIRAPIYREADLLVGVDFRSPPDTARYIAEAFYQARRTEEARGSA